MKNNTLDGTLEKVLFLELRYQFIKFIRKHKKTLFIEEEYYYIRTLRDGLRAIDSTAIPTTPYPSGKHKGLFWGAAGLHTFYEKSHPLACAKAYCLLSKVFLRNAFTNTSKFYSQLTEQEILNIKKLQLSFKEKSLKRIPHGIKVKEYYSFFFLSGSYSFFGKLYLKYLNFLWSTKLRPYLEEYDFL